MTWCFYTYRRKEYAKLAAQGFYRRHFSFFLQHAPYLFWGNNCYFRVYNEIRTNLMLFFLHYDSVIWSVRSKPYAARNMEVRIQPWPRILSPAIQMTSLFLFRVTIFLFFLKQPQSRRSRQLEVIPKNDPEQKECQSSFGCVSFVKGVLFPVSASSSTTTDHHLACTLTLVSQDLCSCIHKHSRETKSK